jgi:hypothetical protein
MWSSSRVSAAVAIGVGLTATPAAAQSEARFVLDSVVSLDEFGGQNVSDRPQLIIDISLGVRLGDNWQLYARPWFRLPRPSSPTAPVPPWDRELYQAGVRYEHSGPISTRVDAGYIVSPIGLGMLDSRASLNPTIAPHLSYLSTMPPFDPKVPRQLPVALSYPLGAQLTASTDRWDARAAVINSAPTSIYILGGRTNPPQTPVFVAGAGVTPIVGLRFGVSMAHGDYATAAQVAGPSPTGRVVTMIGGEVEYAFDYTKLSAELMRSQFETLADPAVAYEWFVEGTQTLSPRWFVAGRQEGVSAPPLTSGIVVGQRTDLLTVEATAGYRVTPDITLRGGYYTRKFYGALTWDQQVAASVVWAHRWW